MKARTNDIISYHTVCCHWNPKSRSMDCWLNQPVNHSDVGITVAVYYMTIVCGFTWLCFMLLKTKPLFLCHATLVGIQNNIIGNQFKTRSARLRFLPGEASILDSGSGRNSSHLVLIHGPPEFWIASICICNAFSKQRCFISFFSRRISMHCISHPRNSFT